MKTHKVISILTILVVFATSSVFAQSNHEKKMFEALKMNDISSIHKFIEDGADINAQNNKGNTALHYAISEGNEEMVKSLIKLGANVNEMNAHYNTPLTIAIINERNQVVDILLQAGANPNYGNNDKMTPTHIAALTGNYDSMTSLIANQADINIMSETGVTPLMLAAAKGHYDVVNLLLRNDAKDLVNRNGESALKWAKQNGHTSVAEILATNPTITASNLADSKVQ
ncbi:ankyrin repeat domain-containing protein [Rhodohalobacter sulfatireducens]|uniref:Ankyrin repeat domain-containing protein n=1 Tax=Rhodohalobacter sulfatireducens TaxID=2911366 RepID=A0ABS9KGL7_9BACT|nr:ankyrin repeat domain-containing protein [Rhodohalobacter sulfatireducens]MCG2589978.1 ankyrin repeat domain-containing protein [Rhodohalobacter sulfatireducens]MDR9366764.1 ankyrin repeat domain-containing protein [Balneolaceae bacterium]MDR9409158.1 ankyrin repeat domain-containing protein [Balneolaceae bacterium]